MYISTIMFIEGLVQGDDLEQYQQIDKELIRYVKVIHVHTKIESNALHTYKLSINVLKFLG